MLIIISVCLVDLLLLRIFLLSASARVGDAIQCNIYIYNIYNRGKPLLFFNDYGYKQ